MTTMFSPWRWALGAGFGDELVPLGPRCAEVLAYGDRAPSQASIGQLVGLYPLDIGAQVRDRPVDITPGECGV
jgi:hypothetical protein